MKKAYLTILAILISTLLIAVLPTEAEAKIYEDTVRLHILANSDSREDQRLKLDVRDAVLSEFGTRLQGSGSKSEAEDNVRAMLFEIEDFAEDEIKRHGYDYTVKATLDDEWYDTREYEDFSLPRGIYSSLKIVIGEGKGKNWWCVMFPPLCLDIATESAPPDDAVIDYTDEELSLIKGKKYNVKFKVLELLSDAFR